MDASYKKGKTMNRDEFLTLNFMPLGRLLKAIFNYVKYYPLYLYELYWTKEAEWLYEETGRMPPSVFPLYYRYVYHKLLMKHTLPIMGKMAEQQQKRLEEKYTEEEIEEIRKRMKGFYEDDDVDNERFSEEPFVQTDALMEAEHKLSNE